MLINELINHTKKPELYLKGNSFMWIDPYISKQLLEIHLNKDIDLASRKESSIQRTIDWIQSNTEKKRLKILDLGCGPGLYSRQLAELGHTLTGIDIAPVSINHAEKTAQEHNLEITYINGNYLDIDYGSSDFDLVIMIYTDFGVLSPDERILLLSKIKNALSPDGLFIFDVLNDSAFSDQSPEISWESEASGGFWCKDPYIHLSKSYIYKDEKMILYQHLVADISEQLKTYNFWTHFFQDDDITELLKMNNFKVFSLNKDVLINGGHWNGKNVTFVVAGKK